ncbi:hypothetical protein [Halofilum ochraceum]|uniref:hypothetical protein n=1 Tax=Halofilum ochraceum TaxID=1611323 RepID=UPI0008DA2AD6|nr:hypothetical protein [Halofilum ochraceum]
MTEIVDFDSFLEIAQASDEPQRLLFIFLKVALPEDATEEERQRYEQGNGGGLMPVMYVDKAPGELTDFSGLVEESRAMGEDWQMVLAAALVGEGGPPSDSAVEDAFSGLIKTVHAGGDLSSMLAFDREGDPVIFN